MDKQTVPYDDEVFFRDAVEEAQPSREMMDLPGMAGELRRPMTLLVRGSGER